MSARSPEGFIGLPAGLHVLVDALEQAGLDRVVPFRVVTRTRFRGVGARSGMLLHGAAGWSEFSPFDEYPPDVACRWFDAAAEAATRPLPPALRTHVPVNVTVPAVGPDEAARLVSDARARTVKVKVAEPGQDPQEDVERVAAVRAALGPDGAIRVDANAAWDLATACERLPAIAEAAGGLQYVEQPCVTLHDLAEVRKRTGIAVAADETLRVQGIDDVEALRAACDVLILKVQPLGGVSAALALAARVGLPAVVSSALETSVGLAVGVRLAAALPELPYACGLDTARLLSEDVTSPLVSIDGAHEVAMADAILRDGPGGSGLLLEGGSVEDGRLLEALWHRLAEVIALR